MLNYVCEFATEVVSTDQDNKRRDKNDIPNEKQNAEHCLLKTCQCAKVHSVQTGRSHGRTAQEESVDISELCAIDPGRVIC
jgi:hypothetical protein